MEKFLESISSYTHFRTVELQLLQDAIIEKHFEKNEMIFTNGKIADEIYFVSKGCVRLFYDVDGVDKTAFFYTEEQFICAGESYTFDIPAIENYQAIEPTELCILSKSIINELLEKVPQLEIVARVATENELITCQKLIASFVTKSAEERYTDLLDKQGELFQRVPQQYIASYLGVSPETLSRIKARVFTKKRS